MVSLFGNFTTTLFDHKSPVYAVPGTGRGDKNRWILKPRDRTGLGFVSANTSLHQYNSISGYKTHHDIKTLVQNCIGTNNIETVRAPSGDLGDAKEEQGE